MLVEVEDEYRVVLAGKEVRTVSLSEDERYVVLEGGDGELVPWYWFRLFLHDLVQAKGKRLEALKTLYGILHSALIYSCSDGGSSIADEYPSTLYRFASALKSRRKIESLVGEVLYLFDELDGRFGRVKFI